jgi:hypothetical protein
VVRRREDDGDRVKIRALLSFYGEKPELLGESVSRACALGVDEVLASDGPYDLYPHGGRVSSGALAWRAIADACEDAGVAWLGWSKRDWGAGNEVEKRNHLLGRALERSEEGDWLLVFDADHMWEKVGDADLKHELVFQEEHAAEVGFAECSLDDPSPSWYQARFLLRAVPGMRYEGAHWRVRYPDGKVVTTLRTGSEATTANVLDLRDHFRVRHTVFHQEDKTRRQKQGVYYVRRDEPGKEVER